MSLAGFLPSRSLHIVLRIASYCTTLATISAIWWGFMVRMPVILATYVQEERG